MFAASFCDDKFYIGFCTFFFGSRFFFLVFTHITCHYHYTYGHIYQATSHLYVTYLSLPSNSIYWLWYHAYFSYTYMYMNAKTTNYVYMQSVIYALKQRKKEQTHTTTTKTNGNFSCIGKKCKISHARSQTQLHKFSKKKIEKTFISSHVLYVRLCLLHIHKVLLEPFFHFRLRFQQIFQQ